MMDAEILAMKPGRELDSWIATEVIGIDSLQKLPTHTEDERGIWFGTVPNLSCYFVPYYSYSISAAWEVAERFKTIEVKKYITDKGYWFCEIKDKVWHRSFGKSAPEAICKAALLSIKGEG